jgi:hypothetical protein
MGEGLNKGSRGILVALRAHLARVLSVLVRSELDKVRVGHRLGADEALLKVGVNHARRLCTKERVRHKDECATRSEHRRNGGRGERARRACAASVCRERARRACAVSVPSERVVVSACAVSA